MQLIERLIAENPALQAWGDGTPANWAATAEVLRFIVEHVRPGMTTLETGAGQTTIAFALAGARHTAITVDASEAERIRGYFARQGLPCPVTFIPDSSDVALPRGKGIPANSTSCSSMGRTGSPSHAWIGSTLQAGFAWAGSSASMTT